MDAVVAAVGGGGLLAGIGVALRALRPQARDLRGRAGNRGAAQALDGRGQASRFDEWTASFVDGAGGKSVLDTMWPLLREYVHESIVVSLDDAAAAMRLVAERARVIAEGAGACAVAAAISPAMAARGHRNVVAVVSGGNVDLSKFAQLVGACPTLNPYDHELQDSRTHSAGSPSWPRISGGPGTRRRARSSAGSTTRCGGRRRTTPC